MKKRFSTTALLAFVFLSVTPTLIFTVASITKAPMATAPGSTDSIIATSSTDRVSHTVEATQKKEEKYSGINDINVLVSCIALNNPTPFENIKKADVTQLMSIALWCVLETKGSESFDFNNRQMIIDEDEVEDMFYSLFTNKATHRHGTITSDTVTFSYDAKKKTYSVPITGVTPAYTGKIIKQKQSDGIITLKVDYIPEANWVQDSNGNIVPPKKEKTVFITLIQNSDMSLTLCSIDC